MGLTFVSLVLGLLPLAGIGFIVYSGWIQTVDGLFMTLILLALSGVFFFDVFLDMRKRGMVPFMKPGLVERSSGAAKPGSGTATSRTTTSPRQPIQVVSRPITDGAQVVHGVIESVDFFEAPIGTPDKTLVLVRNGSDSAQMLSFNGDVRPKLQPGRKARLTFKSEANQATLLSVE